MEKIPIQNLYYLLCYAWDKLEEQEIVGVKIEEATNVVDLLSRVLINGTKHLLKHGLDRGYVNQNEDTGRLRGRIDFNESIKRTLFYQARLNCSFDELDYNVLHNQILKTTIGKLLSHKDIAPDLRQDLKEIYEFFRQIDDVPLSNRVFGMVRLNRNNYFYGFLLNICELLYNNYLVTEEKGENKFKDFLRDEKTMAMVFENFVRNFYKREQCEYKVGRENISWQAEAVNQDDLKFLPKMQTDISLVSKSRKLIIDTKYYFHVFQKNENYEKETLRSNNLYQIFSYLKNSEVKEKIGQKTVGMLLYPTVDKTLELNYIISGHEVKIRTINLNQNWRSIHDDLLKLLSVS